MIEFSKAMLFADDFLVVGIFVASAEAQNSREMPAEI
jgi:hypothetical protein